MVDLRHTSSPKPMRAKYVGSGRSELMGKQMSYRKLVRFTGADHRDAITALAPGDVIFVQYTSTDAGRNRVGEPRVKWIRK